MRDIESKARHEHSIPTPVSRRAGWFSPVSAMRTRLPVSCGRESYLPAGGAERNCPADQRRRQAAPSRALNQGSPAYRCFDTLSFRERPPINSPSFMSLSSSYLRFGRVHARAKPGTRSLSHLSQSACSAFQGDDGLRSSSPPASAW